MEFIWLEAQECMPHHEPRVNFVWQSDMMRERMPQGLSVTSSNALSLCVGLSSLLDGC